MVVQALCHVCNRPTLRTCVACGRPVCEVHQKADGLCVACGTGRRSRPGFRR